MIGTGATALQCVPHVARGAEHLYVVQRTPSAVDERNNEPTDPEWAAALEPGWQRHRADNFLALWSLRNEPEDLVADIRARCGTVFHPVSTCRMGPDPDVDVVDARLRVHGLAGLRIVDASIFPTVVSGNTNAPAIMVGEKGADMILQDHASDRIPLS